MLQGQGRAGSQGGYLVSDLEILPDLPAVWVRHSVVAPTRLSPRGKPVTPGEGEPGPPA